MVIAGAGECGTRAALTLREEGYDGAVTLIGTEDGEPYERPPLSKPEGDAAPRRAAVASLERLAVLAIDYRPGLSVERIDRAARGIRLSDGSALPYARLLIATGARPRVPPAFEGTGARTFRTMADAMRLFDHHSAARRSVLIGAGLIGLELAAALSARGRAVTVLEGSGSALGRSVAPELAEILVARHRAAGVDVRFGVAASGLDAEGVILADGGRVPADEVVLAIGVVPETGLAEAAGLAMENGVAVDDRLRTEDPDIFAAGDCAAADHPLYERRMRFETWRNAQDQGACAARNMLGADEAFARVPWFWSDQHGLGLQGAGLNGPGTRNVTRAIGPDARIVFSLAPDGRLMAAGGLGPGNAVARDVRLAEMLIEKRARPDPSDLADPSVSLRKLLRA